MLSDDGTRKSCTESAISNEHQPNGNIYTDEICGNSYNTRSNKVRVVKTPGGKLQYQHLKKRGSPPKCGDCGIKLPGVRLIQTAIALAFE